MEKVDICVFHKDCMDGVAAAWAVWLKHPEAKFVPLEYGVPPALETFGGHHVVLVDFSYPRHELEHIRRVAGSLLVLDHHKTAQADLQDFPGAVFDLDKAGCRLAWEQFHPGEAAPWVIDYVEDRDLWRWKLPDSEAVSAGLALHGIPTHPHDFEPLAAGQQGDADWCHLVQCGEVVLTCRAALARAISLTAYTVEMGDEQVPIATCPKLLASEVGELLADGMPFGATWHQRHDGRIVVELRSREGGTDVSEVAKLYGGGGHRHAAGFVTDRPWWLR